MALHILIEKHQTLKSDKKKKHHGKNIKFIKNQIFLEISFYYEKLCISCVSATNPRIHYEIQYSLQRT